MSYHSVMKTVRLLQQKRCLLFGTKRLMPSITHNTDDIKNKLTFLTIAKKLRASKF